MARAARFLALALVLAVAARSAAAIAHSVDDRMDVELEPAPGMRKLAKGAY